MTDPSQSAASFGKYLLDQELARGGMSRVFRARLRGPGGFEKKLVVKQILPELASDPAFIEMFVKEANTLVQMSHPSLVPVYELGVVDGVYFLAMEWVEGATVAELLREGPLPQALVAHVGAEIAEALRYAHERFEIIHRDVTPRNVIIDGAGHARLLDFGIAAKVAHTQHAQGELFGSPGYMAPEQLRGEALGPESDLYGLGAVLYEAISGKPALSRSTALPTEPVQVPPLTGIDGTLAALIGRTLEPSRGARPQKAAELATALRRWLVEHHPHGVERELAERAERAFAAREAAPSAVPAPSPSDSSGRIEVRSIATSPVLEELLKQATERIEREPVFVSEPAAAEPEHEEPLLADPEAQRTFRRYARDLIVLSTALMLTVWWAERHPRAELAEGVGDETAGAPAPAPVPVASPPSAAGAPAPAPGTDAPPSTDTPPEPASATAAVAGAPAAPASLPPSVAGSGAPSPAGETAFITLSATPWAEVRIDGRALGVTPQRQKPLRAGKHTLTFSCPPLAREAKVAIEAHPGEKLQVLVDLHPDPANVVITR